MNTGIPRARRVIGTSMNVLTATRRLEGTGCGSAHFILNTVMATVIAENVLLTGQDFSATHKNITMLSQIYVTLLMILRG